MAYKHILVAVDGSNASNLAFQEALKLAQEHQSILRLIYVIDIAHINYSGTYVDYDSLLISYQQQGQQVLKQMEEVAQQTKVKCESCLVELKISEGRIAEKIVAEAKAWPADLLVIGTHGRRGFSHLLLGSVAEGVIRIATTPILLVRSK